MGPLKYGDGDGRRWCRLSVVRWLASVNGSNACARRLITAVRGVSSCGVETVKKCGV